MQRPYHRNIACTSGAYEHGATVRECRDLGALQMASRAFVLFFVMFWSSMHASRWYQAAPTSKKPYSDVLESHLESSGDLSVVEDVVGEARRMRRPLCSCASAPAARF